MKSQDQLRAHLMAFMEKDIVKNALSARYDSQATARLHAKTFVDQIVEAFGPTDDADAVRAEDMLIGLLRSKGVSIPTYINARRGGHRLNVRQTVCLWLGARRGQGEMSGLWHNWERLQPLDIPIPGIIRKMFDPPPVEGGAQCYLDASRITLMVYILSKTTGVPLTLPLPIADAHKRLARMLLALTDAAEWSVEPDDQRLCSLLAGVFGVAAGGRDDVTLRAVRDAARKAGRAAVDDADAERLLTWIIGTSVRGAPPHAVLENEVENKAVRERVSIDLLGGRTTLQNEVLKRLLEKLDAAGETDVA